MACSGAPIGGQITRERAEEQVAQMLGRTRSGAYGLRRAGRAVALCPGFTVPALASALLVVTEDRWMGDGSVRTSRADQRVGKGKPKRPQGEAPCLIW